jgi:tRNA (guanine-N7-)-methyltransferase
MALRSGMIVEPILLDVPDEAGRLDFATVFGAPPAPATPAPIELEIGSGKGTFLLAISQAKPETRFIGFEWAKEYAHYAADRLRRHNRFNCRIVAGEASWWLRCHVPDNSIQALHIYFPDPWPKTRHHKRRLIQLPFLKEVHRILVPGGKLRLVTDHAEYFAHMEATLAAQSDLQVVAFDSPVPEQPGGVGTGMIVGTNFEKKYIAEGRTFHATAAVKPIA